MSLEVDPFHPFEGPEKKVDIEFFCDPSLPKGLRLVPKARWESMLSLINCTILSPLHNELCDAFLLSESSLFVYSHKVIIKTCGQITLLRCVEELLKLGSEFCGASVAYINFSRRNFFFPDEQFRPHTSWDEECAYLKNHFPGGKALVFGPRSCDHHYVFMADYREGHHTEARPYAGQTLEILMTGLDRSVMSQFYAKSDSNFAHATQSVGIRDLLPDVQLDDHQFQPLGYSLNGLQDSVYFTIHVTPQPECSYVSFETNAYLDSYDTMVQKVVNIFKPDSFTVLLFSENQCCMHALGSSYQNFYLRNRKHHQFFSDREHNMEFCSFRQYGTVSPEVAMKRPKQRPPCTTPETISETQEISVS
eukprot:TRINITY_DN1655_c0_g1_i1.p1 TRINITY_DN1655_c0_g1~~TRINITY_DN1655_c0_g1_i1.p1  ORF type:complete len:363 (-),score=26.76 TRINITY_DN1655_c0_g1_i1:108-1196(-)